MTVSLPPLDLLRERRLELGLPPDPQRPTDARRLLLIGAAIGGGLVAFVLLLSAVLRIQQQFLANEIERLSPVRGQVAELDQQINLDRAAITKLTKENQALVKGLVAVRSGSALMTDLVDRTPRGLQLTGVKVSEADLRLKGRTGDPDAFERINAMVLRLKKSPLFAPDRVSLTRAVRGDTDAGSRKTGPEAGLVDFELTAGFRAPLSSEAQLQLLQKLEADGMAKRLRLLQREGLLR
jgi:type IV pilus assembly protein PilN